MASTSDAVTEHIQKLAKKKKTTKGRNFQKKTNGVYNTWSPSARAKRAKTMAAKRARGWIPGKFDPDKQTSRKKQKPVRRARDPGKKNLPAVVEAVQHFPLNIIPARKVHRSSYVPVAERRARAAANDFVQEHEKLNLTREIVGLLNKILGT